MSVSAKLGVFATSSTDGTVALLSLHKRKLIRVYRLESDEEVLSVRIANSSPACLICQTSTTAYSYTINGELLT